MNQHLTRLHYFASVGHWTRIREIAHAACWTLQALRETLEESVD